MSICKVEKCPYTIYEDNQLYCNYHIEENLKKIHCEPKKNKQSSINRLMDENDILKKDNYILKKENNSYKETIKTIFIYEKEIEELKKRIDFFEYEC